jgi:hypothetical protein
MLQQCSSASSCIWAGIVMEEHNTGCQHSTTFLLNGPTQFFSVSQYTSDVIVVRYCMNFHHQKSFSVSEDRCHQSSSRKRLISFFDLFGKYLCIHCFDWSLVSKFTNENQVLSPVTRTKWLRNSWPSLWYRYKKFKAEAILCVLCAPVSIFGTHLAQNLWQPSLTVTIS